MLSISKSQARQLFKTAQFPPIEGLSVADNTLAAIDHLGYVQIDTIHVVERAHQQTLWNRVPDYAPEALHQLQATNSLVFEYWAHAMSYIPIKDWRYYRFLMDSFPWGQSWFTRWHKENAHLLPSILQLVREEGPKCAADFENKNTRGAWWDWKPAKMALEILFWQGHLMVAKRNGFSKVYDLTERVLPKWVDKQPVNQIEADRFLVNRALQGMAVATKKDILLYINFRSRAGLPALFKEMQHNGEIISLGVEGEKDQYYARPNFAKDLNSKDHRPGYIQVLSPFDGMTINRDRLKRLYDVDYTIECYTPAARRKFGYFTQLLWLGDNYFGLADMVAKRQLKSLHVNHLQLVKKPDADELQALITGLARYAQFNKCHKVELFTVEPSGFKTALAAGLKKAMG